MAKLLVGGAMIMARVSRMLECRRCREQVATTIDRVWQDRRGVRWGTWLCAQGHPTTHSLTVQDYEALAAHFTRSKP